VLARLDRGDGVAVRETVLLGVLPEGVCTVSTRMTAFRLCFFVVWLFILLI